MPKDSQTAANTPKLDPDVVNKPEDVVTYISTGKFQDSDNYKSLISSNKTELDKY
ncbi:MAG: hypothetical protein WC393_04315 [Candidatus Nanoarchaeia archaeon]|jgi:hypothetical protein